MTIITFKALSKISTILVTSAMLTLPTVTVSHAEATFDDAGGKLTTCVLDGGVAVATKTGTACWNPQTDETTECDHEDNVDSCYTEPVTEERPTGGRFSKPVLIGGGSTMVMPPDTNTTVGSGKAPLNGKLIMRNVIQN